MKFVKLLVAVVAVLGLVGTANAQSIPLKKPAKPAVESGPLTFSLNNSPRGQVVALPSWACGNITVENSEFDRQVLTFKVNLPVGFSVPSQGSLIFELRKGALATVALKSGTAFSFYWTGEGRDGGGPTINNKIVVLRHCPTDGCKQLCDCAPERPRRGVTVVVTPWANVSWRPTGIVCPGCIPMEWYPAVEVVGTRPLHIDDLSPGEYEFKFESDKFETVTRVIRVPGTPEITVNLEQSGQLKIKLK